ncbi:FAD-binding oxidoreductase [Alloyangia pacifica]|uniref:FAD-binding oxidoreductase n=1 Tax=Alloyangia pacifica TaxID=311180 RepID=UPI001CD6B234|nr:FAD-binding oxidoreductase [Alloyangia pacifica]MCA0998034.1 FAD-binding oxidoreductase [Alloyangia pacifica]
MKLTGWGRFAPRDTALEAPRDAQALRALLARPSATDPAGTDPTATDKAQGGAIARGNGRAYGDAAVGAQTTLSTRHLNRMIAFDAQSGQLVAEAGVLLSDVIDAFLPRGWFPMVTPGTRFVTLGGMAAADVHGKNHHLDGSFRACVDWLDLMGPDGEIRRCSRTENAELFDWTLGGMGLTGVILRLALRLRAVESGWIGQTTLPCPDLDAVLRGFEEHEAAPYSVAWIDCLASGSALGRSLLTLGHHLPRAKLEAAQAADPFASAKRGARKLPFDLPGFALNRHSVRGFNALYYRRGCAAAGAGVTDWQSYFYPLDAILGWNRIYGRRGFVQFQCVLPDGSARAGLAALLSATAETGCASFLAVLKRFGAQDGAFSFPMQGYTLAMDFPASRRALALLDRLDAITLDHGGRFYLAKDARMRAETLHRADPRAADLAALRARAGMAAPLQSALSQRLSL